MIPLICCLDVTYSVLHIQLLDFAFGIDIVVISGIMRNECWLIASMTHQMSNLTLER